MSEKDGESAAGGFDPAKVAQAQLESLKIQERKYEINKQILSNLGDQLGAAEKAIEIERIRLDESIKYLTTIRDTDGALEDMALKGEGAYKEFEKILKVSSLTKEQQDQIVKSLDNTREGLVSAIQQLEEFRVKQEKSKDFARELANSTSDLARKMGISADFSKTMAGSFVKIGQDFLAGDRASNSKAILGAISGLIDPMNILASLFDIAVQKMIALDKAAVGLRVATGFARDFQGEMTAVAASTAQVGVTLDVSNEAFGAVVKSIKGINQQSPQFIANLGESAAKMTKLGVSAQTSAKNFDLLIKSFKMTDTEATSMMESMAAKASDLGLTAEEMGTEFNSAMGYLSSFGKEGIKAFEDLAAQAGVTGLAISKMLDMTKAFDKFSEGAKKAATLNSVLGTSLSSMALMTMDPAQRMKELRNQINAATGGVNNMTQAQKLFTAEAMGYSSVAEMMADLQASPADLRERAELAERQAKIQDRLANAMTQLVPLADQLSMAFQALATNERLMNFLSRMIDGFSFLIEHFNVTFPLLLGLGVGLKGYTTMTGMAASATAYLATTETATAAAHARIAAATAAGIPAKAADIALVNQQTAAQNRLNLANKYGTKRLMLFAGALAAVMAIYLMRGSPQFYIMPLVIAAGIFLMGKALETVKGHAMLAALVMALLAGAMALVFYGMSALVDSITALITVLLGSLDVLPLLAMNMYLLGTAFLFLGTSAMYGSMGIFMGLAGLTAMLLLFKLTGTSMKDMFGAGEEILKIGTGIEKFGQGLSNISSVVGAIKSSLGDKGLFAGSISGDSTSMILGDGVAVAKLFKNSKIEVDVKMPEISMPKVDVKVFIGNEELKDIIRKEIIRGQR